jgi:hypothetical protein
MDFLVQIQCLTAPFAAPFSVHGVYGDREPPRTTLNALEDWPPVFRQRQWIM